MIVYNITIQLLPAIEQDWLEWQQKTHIPDIMSSGQFTEFKFYRLLDPVEPDSATYITQFFAASLDHYTSYINDFAPAMRQKTIDCWGDQFIAFRTVMEVVN